MAPRAASESSHATYNSTRLHVETMVASRCAPVPDSAVSARSTPRAEKSSRSRSSIGAVRWLTPTRSSCMLEVVARREKVAHGHEVQQHDAEANRRQQRRAPAAPPDSSLGV